jgi:hypothetical protein
MNYSYAANHIKVGLRLGTRSFISVPVVLLPP